jgi:hypothetical protein
MAEYTETETKHLFYNGGDRISEALQYSLPEGHDIHCTARWPMEAPERDFFNVPKLLVIGGARVSIPFVETILRSDRFGGRGVILVDANWEPPADKAEAEKMPVATSRELAIEKGNRHWDTYVKKVAQQWIDECNEARSRGGVPRGASGFVARALKLCGLADPATAVIAQAQENKTNKSEIEEMRETLRKQGELIERLTTAKATNEPATNVRSRKSA